MKGGGKKKKQLFLGKINATKNNLLMKMQVWREKKGGGGNQPLGRMVVYMIKGTQQTPFDKVFINFLKASKYNNQLKSTSTDT